MLVSHNGESTIRICTFYAIYDIVSVRLEK